MNIPRLTDERLRTALNTDQSNRERMCLAILRQNKSYSNVEPRRPEGGRDVGRDIQCSYKGEMCFGAVGFVNSASDSTANKRWVKKKFKADLAAALNAEPNLQFFVFFTNVDLTPREQQELKAIALTQSVTVVDLYYREIIRIILDSPEGFFIRHQYLSIELSTAEQSAFFNRFGNDLEQVVRGQFESVEKKIDLLEFNIWKTGRIKHLRLNLEFNKWESQRRESREHFRFCLCLKSFGSPDRSIMFGGRDDYWSDHEGNIYFGSSSFFFRELSPKEPAWIPGRIADAGAIGAVRSVCDWITQSHITISEFEGLHPMIYVTENLVNRIGSIRFSMDSYLMLDREVKAEEWKRSEPQVAWPSILTDEEKEQKWWLFHEPFWDLPFDLDDIPKKLRIL